VNQHSGSPRRSSEYGPRPAALSAYRGDAVGAAGGATALEKDTYLLLRRAILQQHWAPGSRTSIRELAVGIGVSPTPVRVALKQLEQDGLVTIIPRKHVVITGIGVEDLAHINQMRSVLEALAVRLTTLERPEPASDVLEALVLLEKADADDDRATYCEAHNRFHLLLDGGNSNTRVYQAILELYDYIEYFRGLVFAMPEKRRLSAPQHRAIFAAYAAGDADRAERETRFHLESLTDYLIDHLQDRRS
jgi:DNA-binding GntR family transcriptional regulator